MRFNFTGQTRGAFGPGGFVMVWISAALIGGAAPVVSAVTRYLPTWRRRRR